MLSKSCSPSFLSLSVLPSLRLSCSIHTQVAANLLRACLELRDLSPEYVQAVRGFAHVRRTADSPLPLPPTLVLNPSSQLNDEAYGKAHFENEKIYFQPVPRQDKLSPVEPKDMTKIAPLPDFVAESGISDWFSLFVPVHVMQMAEGFLVEWAFSPSLYRRLVCGSHDNFFLIS